MLPIVLCWRCYGLGRYIWPVIVYRKEMGHAAAVAAAAAARLADKDAKKEKVNFYLSRN